MTKKLYLIDGSGFIFRAYHSLPPLTRPDGTPVGAVYGFVNMISKLAEGTNTDYMAVIFDAGRQTFRNRLYDKYKANRPEAPEDLVPQFAIVREATRALNLPALELADYEADDLIATYAKQAKAQGIEVVIISSDKDLMQLIEPGVSMYDPMKQKPIGEAQVIEKFGVPPDKVLDVLSLIGDTSDNIPGVPSIGPKTAAELIAQFGSLDEILARAGEIKQNKRREVITTYKEQALLSRELVKLCETVPVPMQIEEMGIKAPDPAVLFPFLQEQGFKSLITRMESKFQMKAAGFASASAELNGMRDTPAGMPAPVPVKREAVEKRYTLVRDMEELRGWVAEAKATGYVAFDTETTSLNAMTAELVGFSLSTQAGKACYVPLNHVEEKAVAGAGAAQGNLLFDESAATTTALARVEGQIALQEALALLKPLLADISVLKIGHNIKYDMLVLKKYGVEVHPVEDTMLMSYTLAAGSHGHGMDEVAEKYLGITPIAYNAVTGTGKSRISFAQVELEKARDYAAEDADITYRLWECFRPLLFSQHLVSVYETIDRPLIPTLVEMEEKGILVNTGELTRLSGEFEVRMKAFEIEIFQLAGREFNVASPKQLGEILFDELRLPGGKKSSKTGSYGTGAEVLEELAEQGHILPQKVLDWRQLAKLKSTYTDSLQEQINPNTGRVHTSYAMAIASTGRLSSTDPNLQNIPIRTEEGRKIRHAFVSRPGYKLISADYSQIELRLLADVANIDTLKEAFRNGDDIHAITASQMFGVPVGQVGADLRRKAKTINFGIIYGISAHGLAMRLGIGRGEAAQYIDLYFRQYPGIREYMETTKEFARKHGYVSTIYGRRCHVPGIADRNAGMRSFSERAAINAPLQGSAADIIKKAMVTLDRQIKEQGLALDMLLQVHDELVFEAPEAEAERARPLIKKAMEDAAHLSVPLTVEIGIGTNWGEIH